MLYSVFRQMVRLPASTPTQTNRQAVNTTAIKTTGVNMMRVKRAGIKGLVLALTLAMASCATSPDTAVVEPEPKAVPEAVAPKKETKPSVVEAPPAKDPVPAQADGTQPSKPSADGDMVTVEVYTIDDQCNDFIAQPVQVSSAKAIDEAVGKAMSAEEYTAFKLAGYQVNVTGGTAIVDMQLAPGSERKFVSLSSCEQRSLFGSIEETLLNNDAWNVNSVKFTSSGKDIIL
ncbi:MAG: hypothetical protein DCF25_14285 [Leptolyngbya foveolarum]|uniref:Sporulation/spore germination protein n=1 Tax=Leptolyngbya foveolarum TaxID=47253 RepID=A0A2W4U7J1_9CYAN|nr:MAG: hypothetical protein DCF25_14285 [Leptolyngbya foveolarum]